QPGGFKSFAMALEDLNKKGDAARPTPRPPLARLAHDDCDHARLRTGHCPPSAPELLGRANGHHRYPEQHWWIFEGGNRPSRWFDLRRAGWRRRCGPAARLHADHSWPRPRRRHNAARSAHRLRAALPHRACHRGHRAVELGPLGYVLNRILRFGVSAMLDLGRSPKLSALPHSSPLTRKTSPDGDCGRGRFRTGQSIASFAFDGFALSVLVNQA